MCGLFGVWHSRGQSIRKADVVAARDAMRERGPDHAGLWIDQREGIALAHRRLSILDLSPLGHQPMANASGDLRVVFNGEIYNYRALRSELERDGRPFTSRSDTEVILRAYEAWGVDAFARFNGMFAIAIWDGRKRELVLARDHIGEKPLFYSNVGGSVVFGSTLKALAAWPDLSRVIDPSAVYEYLQFGFVRPPHTLFRDVRKVPPGTWVRFASNGEKTERRYFDLASRLEAPPLEAPLSPDPIEALHQTLRDAVAIRLESDVPLGAFLSGGIDSSLVVALMASIVRDRVRTFTIGFANKAFDESASAHAIAKHLRVENTMAVLTGEDVLKFLPTVVEALDEPMADFSILPTMAVASLARRHITVALTGDGGDELFGGYRYYLATHAFEWYARAVPPSVRKRVAEASRFVSHPGVRRTMRRSATPDAATFFGRSGFYRGSTAGGALDGLLPPDVLRLPADVQVADFLRAHPRKTMVEAGMLYDALHTLPEVWLTKVDRATMAVALEARAPLLDPRVVESAFRLDLRHRISGKTTKVALRRILEQYVPRELFERPKQGFTPPLGDWFRGEMREQVCDRLSPAAVAGRGFLLPEGVEAVKQSVLQGGNEGTLLLWAMFFLELWLERYASAPVSPARASLGDEPMAGGEVSVSL